MKRPGNIYHIIEVFLNINLYIPFPYVESKIHGNIDNQKINKSGHTLP